MLTLKPFQETGRDFLASRTSAILADDMGLGKTLMAIEAIKKLNLVRGIIVCPLSVRPTWMRVIKTQYPNTFVKEMINANSLPDYNAINVVNYDIIWREPLIKMFKESNWQFLIMDEGHYLKNTDSKRTKLILGKQGLYNFCQYKWWMTGTPILNRPIELYPVLRSLAPNILADYTDFYRYAYKFCGAFQDTFGFNATGATNLKELADILSPLMIRRMKEEVLDQLPEVQYEKIYLAPSNKLLELNEQDLDMDGQLGTIKRAIGELKVKPAVKHIENLLLTKNKLVVFTWHKSVAAGLKEEFKDSAVVYTGSESIKEKERAIKQFQELKDVKIFIGQIEAAGIGIDGLQQVCDTCLFVELHCVPGKIKQAVDRLNRIGQQNSVLAQFLVVENSIDEKVVDQLCYKSKNIKTILQEKGDMNFIEFRCAICKDTKEMKELKHLAGLSVCKNCQNVLEVLT